MLKMRSTDPLLNSLANYPTILREMKKHLREGVKERVVRGNVYKTILQEEDNDGVENIEEKTPKRQRANILGDSCPRPKKGSKKKKKKKQGQENMCVACERSGHQIQKCWFLFPDIALPEFVLSDAMKKFMEDQLAEDPKLKKSVETIRRQMAKKNPVEEVVEA